MNQKIFIQMNIEDALIFIHIRKKLNLQNKIFITGNRYNFYHVIHKSQRFTTVHLCKNQLKLFKIIIKKYVMCKKQVRGIKLNFMSSYFWLIYKTVIDSIYDLNIVIALTQNLIAASVVTNKTRYRKTLTKQSHQILFSISQLFFFFFVIFFCYFCFLIFLVQSIMHR